MSTEKIIESFKNLKKITGTSVKKFLKTNKDDEIFLNEILSKTPEWESIQNVIIGLINNVTLKKCKICGKLIPFSKSKSIYCSKQCMYSDKEILNKMKSTNLKRYGTDNPSKSDFIKEKTKKTNLEKYGVDNAAKSNIVKDKIKKTNLERYGVECTFQNEEIKLKSKLTMIKNLGTDTPIKSDIVKEKIKKTNLERYGVECTFQNKDIIKKSIETRKKNGSTRNQFINGNPFSKKHDIKDKFVEKYGKENPLQVCEIKSKVQTTNLEKYGYITPSKNNEIKDKISKSKHNYTYESNLIRFKEIVDPLFTKDEFEGAKYYDKKYRWRCCICGNEFEDTCYSHIPRCLKCHPYTNGYSYMELELLDFVKEYFPNVSKNRKIIYPKEIDIFIPELNVGIEFNGSYWHSENNGIDKFYHIEKTKLCEEKGIKLIHVFEYEWIINKDLIKKKLLTSFGLNDIYCIDECSIKEQIINDNEVKIGLIYEDELNSSMTFKRLNSNDEWELMNFSENTHIVGQEEKMIKHFREKFMPISIITYVDRKFAQYEKYFELGFEKIGETEPDYSYVKNNLILNRNQCNKLNDLLGSSFDENLSETENMIKAGYNKIFDCGQFIFIKHFE